MKPKILVFDGGREYARPFKDIWDIVEPDPDLTMVGNLRIVDAIIFTGGSDVTPALYGDKQIDKTHPWPERDKLEEVVFRIAVDQSIPILGICRGAQLACAMAGGRLVQDVTGHTKDHTMETIDGKTLQTSSLHHQMMLLGNIQHQLLAWSKGISSHYLCGAAAATNDSTPINYKVPYDDGKEPEVVYFPEVRALGIQGHPEMMYHADDAETLTWFRAQATQFLVD